MDVINAITKVLYPQVAKTFQTTPSRVERAIRHAIEVAWDPGDLDTLQRFFGYTVSNTKGKPTNSEQLDSIAHQLDDALSSSRHSYSSYKLFQLSNALEQSDKKWILYRYRMITSLDIMSANLPSLYATIGSKRVIDIEYFLTKYRALLICVLGNELRALDTPFACQIKTELEASIKDTNFFQLNRRLRNNLHYETTDVLTEAEMDIVLRNQPLYFSIIEKHFRHSMNIDIDKECKTMTGFSEAFRASSLSRDEFDRYYYFYFIKYLITGKL